MTLIFDLMTWYLFATHHLVMMIICAKLFSNPTKHVLVRIISPCHDDNLCQIIFKSHHVWLSYGLDTILDHTHGQVKLYMPFRHFMARALKMKGSLREVVTHHTYPNIEASQ